MLETQQKTHEFMKAVDLPTRLGRDPSPYRLNFDLLKNLVFEEGIKEFFTAMDDLEKEVKVGTTDDGQIPNETALYKAWVKVIDAICDTIVVLHNTTCAMGIDLQPFFEEVHKCNMAKKGGAKRADGKALKPLGWAEPDHIPILIEQISSIPDKDFLRKYSQVIKEDRLDEFRNKGQSVGIYKEPLSSNVIIKQWSAPKNALCNRCSKPATTGQMIEGREVFLCPKCTMDAREIDEGLDTLKAIKDS